MRANKDTLFLTFIKHIVRAKWKTHILYQMLVPLIQNLIVRTFTKLIINDPRWYGYLKLKPAFLLQEWLTVINPKKGGFVYDGDNNKWKILGFDTTNKSPSITIGEVLSAKGLKYDLLCICQLYDKGNSVTFDSFGCRVIKFKPMETLFTNSRSGNIYTISLNKNLPSDVCFLSNRDESRIWHMKIAHIHMDHLNKLVRKDLVDSLSNLHFAKNILRDAFQKGNKVRGLL